MIVQWFEIIGLILFVCECACVRGKQQFSINEIISVLLYNRNVKFGDISFRSFDNSAGLTNRKHVPIKQRACGPLNVQCCQHKFAAIVLTLEREMRAHSWYDCHFVFIIPGAMLWIGFLLLISSSVLVPCSQSAAIFRSTTSSSF